MRLRFIGAAPVLVAAIVACSSSSGGGSNVSVAQACSDLAGGICDKIQSCYPFLMQYLYGDATACQTAQQAPCVSSANANGSGATASNVEACSQAYGSASCSDLFAGTTPSACQIHGTLAPGAACGASIQCSGTSYCNLAANQECGACAAQSGAGGACTTSSACQTGLTCSTPGGATMGTCVAEGAQGAACSATRPCQASLACVGGTCVAALKAGATCNPAANACDASQGLQCNPMTKTCAMIALASAGGSCGAAMDGTYTACKGGASCKLGSTGTTGTCTAPAAAGQACASNGPTCAPGTVCLNSVCVVPDASSCH